MLGSGKTSTTISNKEVDDIIKKSGLLIKSVSETIENEAEKEKVDLLAFFWVN